VVLFAIALTIYTLSYIVAEPWHIIPGLAGDSTKNTYTYLYQSAYGHGYWFDGMNYPYGEHIVYTDGQPLLSVFFASMGHVSAATALTVLWWLIGLSYVLSVFFIYRILVHFGVSRPVAVIFAGLISIFSPQLFRVGGHYALSYVCVVPMLFYWTLQYYERAQKKYCGYIFIMGVVTAFLHPYFAAMVLMWGLFYVLAYTIAAKGTIREKGIHVWPVLVAIFSVFLVVTVTMKITDPVHDRPLTPYGLLDYTTFKRDITTSIFSPVWRYVREHNAFTDLVPHISEGSEGYTYVGLVVIIAVVFSLLRGIAPLFKKDKDVLLVGRDKFSIVWLLLAAFALAFSMGVPYIWNMEWLLSRFTFLRQFRSLGRFSWIFYYIITIYAVVVIHARYKNLLAQQRWFDGYAVLVLAIFIWGYEASGYTEFSRGIASQARGNYDVYFSKKEQSWPAFMQEHHVKSADFQAIMILGYYHIGSDKLWVGEPGERMTQAGRASFQLQIPIVNVMMSRTSLSQTMKQVKTVAGPYADKPLLSDIKNRKPLLLLTYDHDSLDEDQKYLLRSADYIGHYSMCNVYALYPDRVVNHDRQKADSINMVLPQMPAVSDSCVQYKGEWAALHFDSARAQATFSGAGAIPCIAGHDSVIGVIPVRPQHDSQVYELSCWFLLSDKDYTSPYIAVQSLDSAGEQFRTDDMLVKWSTDNQGMWFRGSFFFALSDKCRAIRCKLVCEVIPSYIALDELLLRPEGSVIISKAADSSVLVNNHLFKKKGGGQ